MLAYARFFAVKNRLSLGHGGSDATKRVNARPADRQTRAPAVTADDGGH